METGVGHALRFEQNSLIRLEPRPRDNRISKLERRLEKRKQSRKRQSVKSQSKKRPLSAGQTAVGADDEAQAREPARKLQKSGTVAVSGVARAHEEASKALNLAAAKQALDLAQAAYAAAAAAAAA